jgi:hypothetical protein
MKPDHVTLLIGNGVRFPLAVTNYCGRFWSIGKLHIDGEAMKYMQPHWPVDLDQCITARSEPRRANGHIRAAARRMVMVLLLILCVR